MSWTTLCGHETQTQALRHALQTQRVPHALILSGPRQVGKTTIAQVLAQALLCERSRDGDACGACEGCRRFASGGHPDCEAARPVLIRERAGEGEGMRSRYDEAPEQMSAAVLPIDLVRPLRERASRRSARGGHKVVLIYDADHLTADAQDALLKTIEEPIAGLSIILVAENLTRLHATIHSRCWVMPCSLVPTPTIERWLLGTLPVEIEAASRLAARAGGRPGAAWRRWKNHALLELDARLDDFANEMRSFGTVKALRLAEQFEPLAEELFAAEREADPNAVTLTASSGHLPKIQRSSGARLIDELARRVGQRHDAARLDALLEAKHHLLQNGNIRLALDVMFLRCAR